MAIHSGYLVPSALLEHTNRAESEYQSLYPFEGVIDGSAQGIAFGTVATATKTKTASSHTGVMLPPVDMQEGDKPDPGSYESAYTIKYFDRGDGAFSFMGRAVKFEITLSQLVDGLKYKCTVYLRSGDWTNADFPGRPRIAEPDTDEDSLDYYFTANGTTHIIADYIPIPIEGREIKIVNVENSRDFT